VAAAVSASLSDIYPTEYIPSVHRSQTARSGLYQRDGPAPRNTLSVHTHRHLTFSSTGDKNNNTDNNNSNSRRNNYYGWVFRVLSCCLCVFVIKFIREHHDDNDNDDDEGRIKLPVCPGV